MTEAAPRRWTPFVPFAAAATLLVGAILVGFRFGAPAVVLWCAFASLAGAILLFWESLRTILAGDDLAIEDLDEREGEVVTELEERKRAALRALKDIEFEHSIQRISDDDYEALRKKYRAQARAALEAVDRGLGAFLTRAEEMVAQAGEPAKDAPKNLKRSKRAAEAATATPRPEAAARRACASCETENETDAVFCKKCGSRLASET